MKKLYSKDDYQEMPWKNGLGKTTELYKGHLNTHDKQLDYDFRLSIATLSTPAPFSLFPEFKRIIMLQEGKGFILHKNLLSDSTAIVIDNLHCYHTFSGSELIQVELINGPCLDFNIFWNPQVLDVQVTTNPKSISELTHNCRLLYCFNRMNMELTFYDQESIGEYVETCSLDENTSIYIGVRIL